MLVEIFLFLVLLIVFALVLYFAKKYLIDKQIERANLDSKMILEHARLDAENLKSKMVMSAQEEIYKMKENAEIEHHKNLRDLQRKELIVSEKEALLNEKISNANQLESNAKNQIDEIKLRIEELSKIKNEQIKGLEKISHLSSEDAKNQLIATLDKELLHEKANSIINFEKELKSEKENLANNILADAILRYSFNYISSSSVSAIRLPNDEIKGCIIGREGRNIRALESLTGVDLIVDDTPETIVVSSFDPYKREIAKIAIELLISDGRIQPLKIEEMVEKARKEVEKNTKKEGQKAILDLQICEIHSDLVELVGKLKYRTSYGQNALQHSLEVGHIAGLLASEMHLDESLARRCGLLHDIGKTLSYTVDGSHVDIGVKILKKYSESNEVINAVASHHGDCKPESVIAVLVQAADTISASRPGARKENLENYIQRIKRLETLVNDFDFVEKCYAIQAGREIRVIVSPDKVSDDEMVVLSREICKKIEDNLNYPGQIRVNMIRESRVIEYAK